MADGEEQGVAAAGFVPMATPEQVLNAGGVSKRRRNIAGNRRRSPSGTRTRRPQTPEPPKRDYGDEEDNEAPVKTPRSKSKTRSVSSSDDNRRRNSAQESEPENEIISASLTISPAESVTKPSVTGGGSVTKPSVTGGGSVTKPSVTGAGSVAEVKESLKVDETVEAKEGDVPDVKDDATKAVQQEETTSSPVTAMTKDNTAENDGDEMILVTPARAAWWPFLKDVRNQWRYFRYIHQDQYLKLRIQCNQCAASLFIVMVYCGIGGLIFRFTEGAFESFYKCGVKRVKRDFIDSLWTGSFGQREEVWKSNARRKLMEFEEQLHTAHEAGVTSYSGQRSWSFLNAVVYCLTVVTTIGYGHISPSTTTGRAITIVYAIFGIPMFLILLTDFGKLFTRGIKFLWAFVRRLYYTGSCRKVRRTGPVQDVMKGVQLVYNFATNRRPSQMADVAAVDGLQNMEAQQPINPPLAMQHDTTLGPPPMEGATTVSAPGTPSPSTFEVDDEFNLPISVAIVVLLLYIFVGATMYYIWETWGFFESFYFVFISMSTIGFGDFVPQHPMYMMASIVYLIFGLALTSMCINVVQEKLSASFQQASAKIGATIGLRMAEEEGVITPVPPPEVEMPEVHKPTVKKTKAT